MNVIELNAIPGKYQQHWQDYSALCNRIADAEQVPADEITETLARVGKHPVQFSRDVAHVKQRRAWRAKAERLPALQSQADELSALIHELQVQRAEYIEKIDTAIAYRQTELTTVSAELVEARTSASLLDSSVQDRALLAQIEQARREAKADPSKSNELRELQAIRRDSIL